MLALLYVNRYAVTLVGAALASIEWHTHHATMNCTGGQDGVRVPGRQTPPRVLILGLGGGAMASFLARYAPTVSLGTDAQISQ